MFAACRQFSRPVASLLALLVVGACLGMSAPAVSAPADSTGTGSGAHAMHDMAAAADGHGVECPHCGEVEVACAVPTDCDTNPVLAPRDDFQPDIDSPVIFADRSWPRVVSTPPAAVPVSRPCPPGHRLHLMHSCFRE